MDNECYIKKIAIIMVAASIVSLTYGIDIILFPYTLEARGINISLIGISETIAMSAVLFISPIIPWLIKKLSILYLFYMAIILRVLVFLIIPLTSSFLQWISLNFLLGVTGYTYFVLLQSWISDVAPENKKGISIGIFAVTFSTGIALAPFILDITGFEGYLPFLTNALIMSSSLGVIYFSRKNFPKLKEQNKGNILVIIKKNPLPIFASFVGDFVFFGLITFLFLYGIYSGLPKTSASYLLTAFTLGSLTLDIFMGILCDKFNKKKVIFYCIIASIIFAYLMPYLILKQYAIWILLFFWCGTVGGIYISALSDIATKYKGIELITANAAFTFMGSIGGMLGTFLIGIAMDIWKPNGLNYAIIAICTIYLTIYLILTNKQKRKLQYDKQ